MFLQHSTYFVFIKIMKKVILIFNIFYMLHNYDILHVGKTLFYSILKILSELLDLKDLLWRLRFSYTGLIFKIVLVIRKL